jgi:uncharacterized membrane protein YhaH (DUF805 family)
MAEPTTPPGTASSKLRLVIYSHVFGVICAAVASRLDGMSPRQSWHELIFGGAAIVTLVTLFACPVLTLGLLIAYRNRLHDRDLFGAIVLECLIVTAQLIALLPAVQ